MRPKGLAGLLFVVLLIGLFFYLLSDRFIENSLEGFGESVVGAKVEIENLSFSLLGLSISWDRLQVADPNDTWKNLFETGTVAFDMQVAPLARKKINIDLVEVSGIRVGTRRATDGSIPPTSASAPPGWVDEATENLQQQVAAAPILNLGILKKKVDVDSVMKLVDVKSIQKLAELETLASKTRQNWQANIRQFDPKNDLAKVEKQLQELRSQDMRGVKNLVAAAKKAKAIYGTLNTLEKDIQQKKQQFSIDFGTLRTRLASIDSWVQNDVAAIRSKANLGDFSPQNIGTMLFGKKVSLPLAGWLKYIALAREYMPVAQEVAAAGKVERPPRLQGQDIRFPITTGMPDFLIEQIVLSAASNQQDSSEVLSVSGEVKGIASDQKVYGHPLTFALNAHLPDARAYAISGKIDHTGEIPEEQFSISASGVRMGSVSLPARPYLPTTVHVERGDLRAHFTLVGDMLDLAVALQARPVRFFIPDSLKNNDIISKVTTSVFSSMDMLELTARITGHLNDLKLHIRSNIDDVLAQRISGIVGESLRQARTKIERRVTAMVSPQRHKVEKLVLSTDAQVRAELNTLEERIKSKMAEVDKKKRDIEARIKKEKDKAKQGVKKKLKGLFDRN